MLCRSWTWRRKINKSSPIGQPSIVVANMKTIHVDLLDSMRLDFKEGLNIKSGETIRFIVTNKGLIEHEFFIGTKKEQASYRMMMRKRPSMKYSKGNVVTVIPGQSRDLVWKFSDRHSVMFSAISMEVSPLLDSRAP